MKHTPILLLLSLVVLYIGMIPVEGGPPRLPLHSQAQNENEQSGLQAEIIVEKFQSRRKRAAIVKDSNKLWPNNVVPYSFNETSFNYDQKLFMKDVVLPFYEKHTCIDFRTKTSSDTNWLTIEDCGGTQWSGWNSGCVSNLGFKKQGEQFVCLSGNNDCKTPGLMFHELGHVLGLKHEHQRGDRDTHVTVNYANIQKGSSSAFDKFDNSDYLVTAYDLRSVMHYDRRAFSKDYSNLYTITAKVAADNAKIRFVKLKLPSYLDIKKINEAYNCKGSHCKIACSSGNYVDKNCKCVTEQTYKDDTCVDFYATGGWGTTADCTKWKSWGECTNNLIWMAFYCRKTCDQCGV
ncbi:astacin-like metalloprotease toxin 3 [Lineus longissimus]|uniref:astacin-like metalloprotease toxin 3 n=1 Tax=Lineus longissimus TaxID=88925 RepID=UPI00315D17BC